MAAEAETASTEPLLKTPLHARHVTLGARMVPFAGYDMPVQYPAGIMAEHNWTRESAGLFDVSHMGQAFLVGPDHETTARALDAHNLLALGTEAQFGGGEQTVDHVVATCHPVIDQLGLAIFADHEQRRRFPDGNRCGKFDKGLPPIIEGSAGAPGRPVTGHGVIEVQAFDRQT